MKDNAECSVSYLKLIILLDVEGYLFSLFALIDVIFLCRKLTKKIIDNKFSLVKKEAIIYDELQYDPVLVKSEVDINFSKTGNCLNTKYREFCDHIIDHLRDVILYFSEWFLNAFWLDSCFECLASCISHSKTLLFRSRWRSHRAVLQQPS